MRVGRALLILVGTGLASVAACVGESPTIVPEVDPSGRSDAGAPPAVTGDASPTPPAACTKDCRGGDCVNGRCGPVVVASGLKRPFAVAADADGVYFTELGAEGAPNEGSLSQCTGNAIPCAVVRRATGLESPRSVAITSDAVFVAQWWSRTSPGPGVHAYPRATTDQTQLRQFPFGAYAPRGLAARGDKVWIAEKGDPTKVNSGNVGRLNKSSATYVFEAFVVSNRAAEWVATVPSGLSTSEFFTADRSLYQRGRPNALVSGTDFIDLTDDGVSLYWIAEEANAKIYRARSDSPVEAIADAPTARGLAADGTGVYWLETGNTSDSGKVKWLKPGATTPETLVENVPRPQKVAVTATDLWITVWKPAADGELWRLAKP